MHLPNPTTTETPSTAPLSSVQEKLLEELKLKYNVLYTFTISSTKISKRDARILEHLRKEDGDTRPRVAFLHARPSDVNKMITIIEQVKRDLAQKGSNGGDGRWFQYNMLCELPTGLTSKSTRSRAVSDDMAKTNELHSDDEDDFEMMESRNRLEKAIGPQAKQRTQMSLSIFIAQIQIPELKGRDGITTQTNEKGTRET